MMKGAVGPIIKQATFLLMLEKNPIGGILVSKINRDTALIPTISIHPDYQNKKLGSYLLQEAIIGLSKAKIPRVLTSVTLKNHQAVRLFSKAGFLPYQTHIDYTIQISKQ